MPRPNAVDRLALLRKRQEEINNQIKALSAREKQQQRKQDTRRKVIAGALALEHMTRNPQSAFAAQMRALLLEYAGARNLHLFPDLMPMKSTAAPDTAAKPATPIDQDSKDELTVVRPPLHAEHKQPAGAPTGAA